MRTRTIGLAVMLVLCTPGAQAGSGETKPGTAASTQDEADSWEPPIIGWKCSDGIVLPGNRRVALHSSTIPADPGDAQTPPLRYEFVFYRDDTRYRIVDAYVSWTDLDGSGLTNPRRLYFTLRGKLPRRGVVKFRGNAGNEISVPVRKFTRYEDSFSRKAYIDIADGRLISEFLKSSLYTVEAGDVSASVHFGELSLLSYLEATEYHALLQQRMRAKLADHETQCVAVRAPEPSEADIV
jgi:hypothetical protein